MGERCIGDGGGREEGERCSGDGGGKWVRCVVVMVDGQNVGEWCRSESGGR